MSSTAVAKRNEVLSIVNSVEFKRDKLAPARPETGLAVERFVRVYSTYLGLNPSLLKATKPSLLTACIRGYQDGLLPDGRESAIVLFKDQAQYMPMVQGLRKIAALSGFSLRAEVVYEHDTFRYELGLEPILQHTPAPLGTDQGKPIGAYAVARHDTFGAFFEVMSIEQIEKVRAVSRADRADSPWRQWWEEMAKKTVARRLFKTLPLILDDRMNSLLDADNEQYELGGEEGDLPVAPSGTVGADAAFDEGGAFDGVDVVDGEAHEVTEDGNPPDAPIEEAGGDPQAATEATAVASDVAPGEQSSFAADAQAAQARRAAKDEEEAAT